MAALFSKNMDRHQTFIMGLEYGADLALVRAG
jgi:hypothetical protein